MSASAWQRYVACFVCSGLLGGCSENGDQIAPKQGTLTLNRPGASQPLVAASQAPKAAFPSQGEPESALTPTTARCEASGLPTQPSPACDAAPSGETIALPFRGGNGELPVVTAMELSGGTLYAGFSVRSCVPKHCGTVAGLFRTNGHSDFEPVVANEDKVVLAATPTDLYWVRDGRGEARPSSPSTLQNVRGNAHGSSPAGSMSGAGYVSGMAVAAQALFTLSAPSDLSETTLERRGIGANGSLNGSEALARIPGLASTLKTNGSSIAWTESTSVVAADLRGKRRHVAELPADTAYRVLEMNDRFAFTMFERESPRGDCSYSVCSLDLNTGEARIVVPPRIKVLDMAANSTHLFWSEGSGVESYQLWTQPLDGGPPRLLACDAKPITEIAANDEAIYWIGAEAHRLDAQSL